MQPVASPLNLKTGALSHPHDVGSFSIENPVTQGIFPEIDHLEEQLVGSTFGLQLIEKFTESPHSNKLDPDQLFAPVLVNCTGTIKLLQANPKSIKPFPSQLQQSFLSQSTLNVSPGELQDPFVCGHDVPQPSLQVELVKVQDPSVHV